MAAACLVTGTDGVKGLLYSTVLGLWFCLATAGVADTAESSKSLSSQCWSDPWPKPWLHTHGRSFAPQPVRIDLRNPSDKDLEICVYDSVCRQIIYSGGLSRRSFVRVDLCSDQKRRGSMLVMDRQGNVLRYQDLRNREIKLRVKSQ